MKNWRSYRYRTSQENKNSSIANDEVALLATRLEFFVPKLMRIMRPWQWLTYIFFWSLFLTVIERHGLAGWSDFMIKLLARVLQNSLTVIPALYVVDYLRPILKNNSILKVSVLIVMLMMFTATAAMALVVLVMIQTGLMEYSLQTFLMNVLFNTLLTGGFTVVFLLYFLRSYRELNALRQSFEYNLTAQNDLIKARTAPHFFFNTMNTLVSLIESNPPKAAALLQHVSVLYRASFSGEREISFEEEVALCEQKIQEKYNSKAASEQGVEQHIHQKSL